MTKFKDLESVLNEVDQQLNSPDLIWLFGAGISFNAGIPLMYPLTDRVGAMLDESHSYLGDNRQASKKTFRAIRNMLCKDHHVEHVLSYLGDLISLANQHPDKTIKIDNNMVSVDDLENTHRDILLAIRYTVEFGFKKGYDGSEDTIGSPGDSCLDQSEHDYFVDALFNRRRAGQTNRPPVHFVTTNYDTLLEDALSSAHVACVDGFAGGATGFWDPDKKLERLEHAQRVSRHTGAICKLHGSIDWVADKRGIAMRVRSARIDPKAPEQTLLIYPQATKYQVTQRDPFARLFSDFRELLRRRTSTTLVICGYSFGDEHINEEIERALGEGTEGLSVLALCRQSCDSQGKPIDNEGLPLTIVNWLKDQTFGKRIRVLGSKGYYRSSLENQLEGDHNYRWWSFKGISQLLGDGVEASVL